MIRALCAYAFWLVYILGSRSDAQPNPFNTSGTVLVNGYFQGSVLSAPDCIANSPNNRFRLQSMPEMTPTAFLNFTGPSNTDDVAQKLISSNVTAMRYVYRLVVNRFPGFFFVFCGGPDVMQTNTLAITPGAPPPILPATLTVLTDNVYNESDVIPRLDFGPVIGIPTPTVSVNVTFFDGRQAVFNDASQVVFALQGVRNESGVYRGRAVNPFGSVAASRTLRVQFRIDFTPTIQRVVVVEGKRLNVTCQVSAAPAPTSLMASYPNGTNVSMLSQYTPLGQGYVPSTITVLEVDSASASHAGNYSCSGGNLLGTSNVRVEVTVIQAPGAPRNLSVVSNSSNAIELAYEPPLDNGGTSALSYVANCSLDMGNFSRQVTTTNLSASLTDLYPGEAYSCLVTAQNVAGSGPAANVTHQLLTGAPCNPGVVVSLSGRLVTLLLTVVCTGGEDITCSLTRSPPGSFVAPAFDCAVGTVSVVDNQTAHATGYMYTFTVSNSNGPSAPGSASTFTGPSTPTTAPLTPSATTLPPVTEAATSGLSTGAIVGIVVGVLILTVIAVLIVIVLVKRRDNGDGIGGTAAVSYKKTSGGASGANNELNYANIQHPPSGGGGSRAGTTGSSGTSKPGSSNTDYADIDPGKTGKRGAAEENPVGAASTIV